MPNKITDDQILLLLAGNQVDKGLHILYEHHFDAIVAQIVQLGGTDMDAADIFQETLIILLDKIRNNQFRRESKLATFLHGIARNCWLHELRTRKRRTIRETNYSIGESAITEEAFEPQPNPPDADALQTLMMQVGETCRKILHGFYVDKKKMKELLEEFHYENEQVLRNRKAKCMKKMRTLLAQQPVLIDQLKSNTAYE